jgi:hypothetical protein
MTQVVVKRPFKEIDHRDQSRLEPAATLHSQIRPNAGSPSTSKLMKFPERSG